MSMIGKSLAHYQISAEIGKGGMGKVYQATDTKLGREVAIKVLPEEFARDADRVARFQREAKLLASLNHPNIAAIHGLEESEGKHFLVMELIEGQTLAERIKAGPITIEEALKLGLQIAEALEAAHEKGVIHRDLKPANIKVTPDGKVKILDFGLAKAYAGDPSDMNLSNSPTLSDAATQQGVILGTAAYMPPEQAKGKVVDKRADIWAFGVVLFEMLAGRQLFTGETVSETLASVIKSEPEWRNLPPDLHPRIRFLLERCLEKDPRNRYGVINDARVDIQKVLADPGGISAQPSAGVFPQRLRTRLALAVAILIMIVLAGAAAWILKPAPSTESRQVTRFFHELPEDQHLNISAGLGNGHTLAVSPDGSQFVYSTTGGLYIRSTKELEAKLIQGTNDSPQSPFFSPDDQWIGYWSKDSRQLKKVAISGGAPVVLCGAEWVLGAGWYADNTIVYSDVSKGIFRVSANGGTPKLLVEGLTFAPQLLPDGKTVIFTNPTTNPYKIVAYSLETGERKELIEGIRSTYLSTGHLVYGSQNSTNLFAIQFDPARIEVQGGPVSVLEGVGDYSAVSDTGTLVYTPGAAGTGAAGRTLVWVNMQGEETPIPAQADNYRYPKISPDGTHVAVTIEGNNTDIWILDLIRENRMRLTFDEGNDLQPIWTPDGKRVVFMTDRDGAYNIYWKAADGTGEMEQICSIQTGLLLPFSWTKDGKVLVLGEASSMAGNYDIGMLSMGGDRSQTSLLHEAYAEIQPQISPDDRWLAYASNESGKLEIFVRPFPDVETGGRWQVSTNGGESALWSPDGRQLFYLTGGAFMAVEVETKPTFNPGKPRLLFRGPYVSGLGEGLPWDIHPDGKRFLMIKPTAVSNDESVATDPRKINIILNWDQELKARVPAE